MIHRNGKTPLVAIMERLCGITYETACFDYTNTARNESSSPS